jgi:hypothetical protein
MRAQLIPDLLTHCTALEFARAVRGGLETLNGTTPTPEHVCVLTAQSALESGRWRSMHRFNPGNIKASESYEYMYCQFACDEIINGKIQKFFPPHPQTNFRAFYDLEVGVLDYLRFLSRRARYAQAWAAASRGDPAAFIRALHSAGYFTASEAPYLKAVVSLFNEYRRQLAEPQRDTEPPADHAGEAQAVLSIAPDPERLLHTEAVLAAASSMDDVMDAVREERNRNLADE